MDMNKFLVLAQDYPNLNGGISLMYIHTRSKYYVQHGMDVTVLNFSAHSDYIIDGVRVITEKTYKREHSCYECLILHAANIKNHFRFLMLYGRRFKKYVFFYHGHEVLKTNYVYSKPYPYIRSSRVKFLLQNIYDDFKLTVWRRYISRIAYKSHFVFVSHWMLDEFLKWTRIPINVIEGKYFITYNSVGRAFEDNNYDFESEKRYDFVTVRGNLDGSKYCVDFVNELAKNNPKKNFLLVGRGHLFNYFSKAKNLEWWDKTMSHKEIIDVLQQSKCALMPTRTDAQGLMMCEMATFGIPVITSDIPVCHEVFDEFDNVAFIKNECSIIDLGDVYETLARGKCKLQKNKKYFSNNTCALEYTFLNDVDID